MLPNQADVVAQEAAHVVQLLPTIPHGKLGFELTLYGGRIVRITRVQSISVLPMAPNGGRV